MSQPVPPPPWPRRPPTLAGAWRAIDDLREVIDGMRDERMIEQAAERGARNARSQWLTTGRGLLATCCLFLTAAATIAAAAHSWLGG